jgi:metallo-beta-lactamase family protein
MKLTFWGAARTVTGSMHELTVQNRSYLLDCGLYQGRRQEAEERNRTFPFACAKIDAAILSHAHIDHSGNLPSLVKNGFAGPIYTSAATADLCAPMLADSGFLQEKDAEFLNKRYLRRKSVNALRPSDHMVHPIYTVEDAEKTQPHFRSVALHTPTSIGPGLTYTSFEAGHILGSTCMLLELEEGAKKVRLGFSGDLGRPGLPIIRDPETLPPVGCLILESTYGDRLHAPSHSVAETLADIVNRTCSRGGKLIVPAFAVGRTQQIVLLLHELHEKKLIPAFPIFVDSPLAVNVTEVFRKHPELFDEEANAFAGEGQDPFAFQNLRYVREVSESKALNDLRGPFMIIAASGMCEAGRIVHHLRNNIGDPRNTILLAGYQAENTLGRKIQEKREEVPIFGELMPLRAEVRKLDELSGHADQREILTWLEPIAKGLKAIFLVHGEEEAQTVLAQEIKKRFGTQVIVPARGESHSL